MKKVEISTSKKEIEEISARTDIKILSLDIKAVEQSFSFQESICAVVYYEDDLNTVEDEQRAEFAKAAMQGMISNSTYTSNISKANADEFVKILTIESIEVADALISELKKQKP